MQKSPLKKYLVYRLIPLALGLGMLTYQSQWGQAASFIPDRNNVFELEVDGASYACAYKDQWFFGTYNTGSGIFTPLTDLIKKKKKQISKTTNTKKKAKLLKSIKANRSVLKAGQPLCELGATPTPTGSASPVPTSGSGGTPTPTPFPSQCFNNQGDSQPGCFGIPTPHSGNKTRGLAVFNAQCTGCHGDKPLTTYPQVNAAFTVIPQMSGYRPSDEQDLYDIVAYYNRSLL